MSDPRTEPRPSQVTVMAGLAILASALMVLVAYDVLGQVESSDIRHEVEDYLSTGSGSGLTLSVDRLIEVMRAATLVGGALSAAALVLAIYVLRRHNGARIGLTVISVLLLPSVLAVQGIQLLPITLMGASLMLWSPSARQWFGAAGPRPSTTVASVSDPHSTSGTPSEEPSPRPTMPPPATTPYGQAPPPVASTPPAAPPPGSAPPPAPPYPGPYPGTYPAPYPAPYPGPGGYGPGGFPPARPPRPGTVVAAAVVTWVSAGLTLLFGVVLLLEVIFLRSLVVTQIDANPDLKTQYSTDTIIAAVAWMAVVTIIWSAAAVAAGIFVFRGANWARAVLAVSAVLAGLLGLLMTLAAIFPVVWLAACVATVWLLFTPSATRYFVPGSGGGRAQVW